MLHAVGTRNLRLSENRYTGPVTVNFFDARPEGDHAFYASFYGRLWLPQIPSAWPEGPNRVMNARCGTCST